MNAWKGKAQISYNFFQMDLVPQENNRQSNFFSFFFHELMLIIVKTPSAE